MDTSAYFIILSQFIAIILDTTVAEVCKTDGPCKCKTSNGTIDLSPITANHKSLNATMGTFTYQYHLCSEAFGCASFKKGVAICQITEAEHYVAGMQNTATFSGDPDTNSVQITYTSNPRTSIVKVVCDPGKAEPTFVALGELTKLTYSFTLTSKYGCLGVPPPAPSPAPSSGISVGTVLVIIFFVSLVVYIVSGVLFMKFVRGAQGTELVPNLGFWTEIPGLVRDGVVFVYRRFKKDPTYSQI